jgi:hypothetical protein
MTLQSIATSNDKHITRKGLLGDQEKNALVENKMKT